MVIVATIRLQACRTNSRMAFVRRGDLEHGIAKGQIRRYEVEGSSWSHIRKVLKTFDVLSFSTVSSETVEEFRKDIGTARGRLHQL